MPNPIEDLWQAVKEKKYDQVSNLIDSHPEIDLVNQIHTNQRSLVMHLILIPSKPIDLIKSLLNHPLVNLNYKSPKTEQTVMDAIISTAQPEILELVIDNPLVLFSKNTLNYISIKKEIADLQGLYSREVKTKGESSESAQSTKRYIERKEKMLSMLRDATIRHAIATSNVQLLQQLHDAGCNTEAALADGTKPRELAAKSGPVKAWYEERAKEREGKAANSTSLFAASLRGALEVQAAIEEATREHEAKQAALYKNAAEKRMERVKTALTNVFGM